MTNLPQYRDSYPSKYAKGTLGYVLEQESGVEEITRQRKEVLVKNELTITKRTAIARPRVTAPLRATVEQMEEDFRSVCVYGLEVLHLGVGKAVADTERLAELSGRTVAVYDPNVPPYDERGVLEESDYHIIWCCYVANVLPPNERQTLYYDIAGCLSMYGRAYITVRSTGDKSIKGTSEFDGVRTSRDTFQKGYTEESFKEELSEYFDVVEIVAKGSGFLVAACGHEGE